MKILLCYGFCHTVVLDKDSKFFGVCREAIDLLKINCHVLSSANHNPMIVERVNCYRTKGLKTMCNERDSVRVALEAISHDHIPHSYYFYLPRGFRPSIVRPILHIKVWSILQTTTRSIKMVHAA